MGDPPKFPTPWEPATHGQIRDLLKSAHAIGRPYLILAHSMDSVMAMSLLRELHTTACLWQLQVTNIIITHYNASYRFGQCLKQAFISSSALHFHKKVCIGFASRKAARVPDSKPSSGRGNSSHRVSSKATPKKDSKAAATNSQGLSTPLASQPSPCCRGQGTSHNHKPHKKDSGKRRKKADDASPAWRGTGHKACKDEGCC